MNDQPTVRAQQFGEELKNARQEAGFMLREVGQQIGASVTKMSRMESGLRGVSVADVAGLCALYGITGTRRDILLELAHSTSELRWVQHAGFATNLSTYLWLEGRAHTIINYETNFVPGLLQSGEYIQAMLRSYGWSEDEVEHRKLDRVQRQRILRRQDGPAFAAIVDEEALHRPIGGRDVQRRQLEHLVEACCQLPVGLRVIPRAVAAHSGLEGSFAKLEFADRTPVIYTENRLTVMFMEDQQALTTFAEVLSKLDKVALSTVESVQLIADLAADLE